MSSRFAAQVPTISRYESRSKTLDPLQPSVDECTEMVPHRRDPRVRPGGHAAKATGDFDGLCHRQCQRRDIATAVAHKSTEGV
jgi:hypothetical protein